MVLFRKAMCQIQESLFQVPLQLRVSDSFWPGESPWVGKLCKTRQIQLACFFWPFSSPIFSFFLPGLWNWCSEVQKWFWIRRKTIFQQWLSRKIERAWVLASPDEHSSKPGLSYSWNPCCIRKIPTMWSSHCMWVSLTGDWMQLIKDGGALRPDSSSLPDGLWPWTANHPV